MAAALIAGTNYRHISMDLQDHQISAMLAKKDEPAFELVFKSHFKSLHAYAFTILRDEAEAEEMVQEIFFKLWEKADRLSFSGSITSYLYRAVHNESLNYIKHQKIKANHRLHVVHSMKNQSQNVQEKIVNKELENKLSEALNQLPEQCRTVFQLSRFEDLKYREIADKLNISVKTVENQMGKALKLLRIKLVDFLSLLLILLNF